MKESRYNVNSDYMKKRKDYHHGDLRAELLKEARAMVEASGARNLSLRACARAIGVDVSAAYRHFKNKDQVLVAVADLGFDDLGTRMLAEMQKAGMSPETAVKCFNGTGRGYVSLESRTLISTTSCSAAPHVTPRFEHLLKHATCRKPSACSRPHSTYFKPGGHIDPKLREGAEFFVWSTVHGIVSLINAGRSTYTKEHVAIVVKRTEEIILEGLAPRLPHSSSASKL